MKQTSPWQPLIFPQTGVNHENNITPVAAKPEKKIKSYSTLEIGNYYPAYAFCYCLL